MPFEPTYTFTPHMVRCLKAIESTQGFLEGIELADSDLLRRLQQESRIAEAVESLKIEGSSLTEGAARSIAENPPKEDPTATEQEFLNYLATFEALEGLKGDRATPLRARDLRNVQKMLVSGVRGSNAGPGEFRTSDVIVGDIDGESKVVHHQPPSPLDVPILVQELLDWVELTSEKPPTKREPDHWVHPAIQAAIVQHRLVWIHPFLDGNGRTARLFCALVLYRREYDFKDLFRLSTYYNRYDRRPYYLALRDADRTADYTRWVSYFLGGLAHEMIQVKKRAQKAKSAR